MFSQKTTKNVFVVALIVTILCALRYAPIINDPLDGSLASWNAGFTAQYIHCWNRAGFATLEGAPHLYVSPTRPLLAESYLHHPPLDPWLQLLFVKWCGFSEFGLRAAPILFASLSGGVLVALVSMYGGAMLGGLAGILYVCSPMSIFYGWMPNPESATLFFILLTLLLHERLRASNIKNYLWVYAAFAAAGLFDWQGLFVASAIWAREAMEPAPERRFRRTVPLLFIGIAIVIFVILLFGAWLGSTRAAVELLTSTARASAADGQKGEWGAWFINQGKVWSSLFSIPIGVACAIAAPWLLFRALRSGDATARKILILGAPGICNIIIFRRHAFDHEFWWYYILPFAAAAPAWLAMEFAKIRMLAVVPFLMFIFFSGRASVKYYYYWKSNTAPAIAADWNRLAGAEDGLLLPFEVGRENLYIKPWVYRPLRSVEELKDIGQQAKDKKLLVRRTICFIPDSIGPVTEIGTLKLTELLAQARAIGPVKDYNSQEFAREYPTVSSLLGAPSVHILTIE